MRIDELQNRFRQAPRHHKIVVGVAVAVVLLVALKLLGSGPAPQHSHVPAIHPAPTPTAARNEASRAGVAVQAATLARVQPAPAVAPYMAATTAQAAAPAVASSVATTATPVLTVTPPAGLAAGLVQVSELGKDQFGQWLSLGPARAVKQPTLDLTVPAPPAGATGTRRTRFTAWIKLASAVQTVTLHVVGGGAQVSATIDQHWSLTAKHSGWYSGATGATQQQTVVSLAPGWHQVRVLVTRTPDTLDTLPVAVELQLGSGNTNPLVPVPYAIPSPGDGKTTKPANTTAKPAAPAKLAAGAPKH